MIPALSIASICLRISACFRVDCCRGATRFLNMCHSIWSTSSPNGGILAGSGPSSFLKSFLRLKHIARILAICVGVPAMCIKSTRYVSSVLLVSWKGAKVSFDL